MKKSDELFNLIRSLSKSEKGYFKKYAFTGSAREEEKNYIRLFDAMDEQQEYDEDKIVKTFKGEQFAKQIHRVKNYLYHIILKSMRGYHSRHLVENTVKEHLQDIHFLHEKGLYPQAKKLLKSARKLAYQYEKFPPLIEILDWERKIVSRQAYSVAYARTLNEILLEREEVMHRQKNVNAFENLFDMLEKCLLCE